MPKLNEKEINKIKEKNEKREYIAKSLQSAINGCYDKYISSKNFANGEKNKKGKIITGDVELLIHAIDFEKQALEYGYSIKSEFIRGNSHNGFTSNNYKNCIRRIRVTDEDSQSLSDRLLSIDYNFVNKLFFLKEQRTTNYNKDNYVLNYDKDLKDKSSLKIGKIFHYNLSEDYDCLKYSVTTLRIIDEKETRECYKSSWKENNCIILGKDFNTVISSLYREIPKLYKTYQITFELNTILEDCENDFLFLFNKLH